MQKQFLQMDLDLSSLLLEDLRVPDVTDEKVTVILIAKEAGGIQGMNLSSSYQKQCIWKGWPIADEMMEQLKHNSRILLF